ncbi:hypothetical protein QUE06_11430 [Lactococcus lactis]|nr:hypothetical protein [Lactococcus lactis]MDM7535543.1 hypothetical protein [Lactococcus lactis]
MNHFKGKQFQQDVIIVAHSDNNDLFLEVFAFEIIHIPILAVFFFLLQ